MRNVFTHLGFGVAIVGCALAVACGDSGDDDGAFGGASGNAGAGAGGSGGSGAGNDSGGMTSGGSPTAGATNGGNTSAGQPGSAGDDAVGGQGSGGDSAGGASAGGADGDTGGCPGAQPKGGSDCPVRGIGCAFDDAVCTCGVQSGNWTCQDTHPDCPATKPAPETLCGDEAGACAYGDEGTCSCPQVGPQEGTWTCNAGLVACPAAQPAEDAECAGFPANLACEYTELTCRCEDDAWSCTPCPAAAPDDDAACTTPGLICPYGGGFGGENCVCSNENTWVCL